MATVARAKLTGERALEDDTIEYTVRFEDADGEEVVLGGSEEVDGSEVVLTDYDVEAASGALTDEDTVNEAFAKLEARIVALEAP